MLPWRESGVCLRSCSHAGCCGRCSSNSVGKLLAQCCSCTMARKTCDGLGLPFRAYLAGAHAANYSSPIENPRRCFLHIIMYPLRTQPCRRGGAMRKLLSEGLVKDQVLAAQLRQESTERNESFSFVAYKSATCFPCQPVRVHSPACKQGGARAAPGPQAIEE